MITKQDLQKILAIIAKQSMKDTQFPAAKALTGDESVAVVQGGNNRLTTMIQLVNYVAKAVNVSDAVVDVPGWKRGTVKQLLSDLYTLATAPRDENGDPITAETLSYTNEVSESITNVKNALDYIIDVFPEKADLTDVTGEWRIPHSQMPLITLHNVLPKTTCPITSGNGLWFDSSYKIRYHCGTASTPYDEEIGEPGDMLYYCDGNAYKYEPLSHTFHKVGDIDLSSYAQIISSTNRLDYAVMPWVVLKSMTTPSVQILLSNEEFCYYNPSTYKVVFHKSDTTTVNFDPQKGVIYYDDAADRFVLWTGNTTNPWVSISESQSVEGKADLLDSTSMLDPEQWPKVVINNIDNTEYDEQGEGDVIYDTVERKLFLLKEYDDNAEPVLVDMGEPQCGTIYCLKSTNALYRWTGSVVNNPWQLISSGNGSSVDISGKADLATNVNMLSVSQWPRVVIRSISPITDQQAISVLSEGDLFVKQLQNDSEKLFMLLSNNNIIPVGESINTVYYAEDTKKFYLYDGVIFSPITSGSVTLRNGKIPGEYCHVLPLASMGATLDNVGIGNGQPSFVYTPAAGDYYADVDPYSTTDFAVYYYGSDGTASTVSTVGKHSILFNKHTGRYYYVNDAGYVVEYSSNGASLDSANLVPYTAMPKTVLDGMNETHGNNIHHAWKAYYCTDGKIRYYYAESDQNGILIVRSVAYDPVPGLIYADKSTGTLYYWNDNNKAFVRLVSSGGGGGSSVKIVNDGDSTTSENTLYFFVFSPSQFVGLYNKLLQNGTEGDVAYSESSLYEIESGYFNVVGQQMLSTIITVLNNVVYCNGVMTHMKYYGTVLPSSLIKYADTSDTAFIELTVSGPFWAQVTSVTVTYNGSVAEIYQKQSDGWELIQSGDVLQFTENDFYKARMLKVVRSDVDYSQSVEVQVTFNNGYEPKVVRVLFSKCLLFYKSGACLSDFDGTLVSTNTNASTNPSMRMTRTDGTNSFQLKKAGYMVVAKGIDIDLSKYNILYAVMKSFSSSDAQTFKVMAVLEGTEIKHGTDASDYLVGIESAKYPYNEIQRVGVCIPKCRLSWPWDPQVMTCDLAISQSNGGNVVITELGLLTLDNPF